jgi:hypothetical protein
MVSLNIPKSSDKQIYFIGGLAVLGIGFYTYRLGFWGNYNKGTDANQNAPVDTSKLKDKTKILYKNIAENLYREFNKTGITRFSNIYPMISKLNPEELKQVVKEFGTRASTVPFTNFALSGEKMNLFTWIEKDIVSTDNLNTLKKLFAPTKLWL